MAWLPSDSGAFPDCIDWHDASDAGTITTSGSNVTQWDDKKNSNDLTVATGSPIVGATLNGLDTVDFDGSDLLDVANATYVGASGYNYTIMMLVPDGGTSQFIFSYGVTDVGGETLSASTQDNSNNDQMTGRLFNGAVDSGVTWSGATLVSFGIGQGAAHSTMEIRLNGADTSHGAGGTNTLTVQTSPRLGLGGYTRAVGGAIGRYDGRIAEFLFFDTEPTLSEKQEFEGYLAHKWGQASKLPTGHPYKNFPPIIATAAGVGAFAAVGASEVLATLSATGIATMAAVAVSESDLSAEGVGLFTAVGEAEAVATLSAAGVGSMALVSVSGDSDFSAGAVGAFAAVGESEVVATLSVTATGAFAALEPEVPTPTQTAVIVSKPDHGEKLVDSEGRSLPRLQQYLDDITFQLSADRRVTPEYTVATVPVAATSYGLIMVTDEVGGKAIAYSDLVDWRRVRDDVIISI